MESRFLTAENLVTIGKFGPAISFPDKFLEEHPLLHNGIMPR